MKRFLNRNNFLWLLLLVITSCTILSSCNKDELDIQQNYPFEVKVMPVPGDISNGQAVEIRVTIERSGSFNDAKYFIRYFQYDGQGTLRYYNEPPYMPNDLYQLPVTQFRLYYTSQSAVSQSFDIWISDNFGNEKKVSFQFNNKD
ncbi:conjugal transfer protein TraQ [Elizabethkingia anophelis]|nr:conjugal transfer protein TraQ [Elizabethkingia anophelis]